MSNYIGSFDRETGWTPLTSEKEGVTAGLLGNRNIIFIKLGERLFQANITLGEKQQNLSQAQLQEICCDVHEIAARLLRPFEKKGVNPKEEPIVTASIVDHKVTNIRGSVPALQECTANVQAIYDALRPKNLDQPANGYLPIDSSKKNEGASSSFNRSHFSEGASDDAQVFDSEVPTSTKAHFNQQQDPKTLLSDEQLSWSRQVFRAFLDSTMDSEEEQKVLSFFDDQLPNWPLLDSSQNSATTPQGASLHLPLSGQGDNLPSDWQTFDSSSPQNDLSTKNNSFHFPSTDEVSSAQRDGVGSPFFFTQNDPLAQRVADQGDFTDDRYSESARFSQQSNFDTSGQRALRSDLPSQDSDSALPGVAPVDKDRVKTAFRSSKNDNAPLNKENLPPNSSVSPQDQSSAFAQFNQLGEARNNRLTTPSDRWPALDQSNQLQVGKSSDEEKRADDLLGDLLKPELGELFKSARNFKENRSAAQSGDLVTSARKVANGSVARSPDSTSNPADQSRRDLASAGSSDKERPLGDLSIDSLKKTLENRSDQAPFQRQVLQNNRGNGSTPPSESSISPASLEKDENPQIAASSAQLPGSSEPNQTPKKAAENRPSPISTTKAPPPAPPPPGAKAPQPLPGGKTPPTPPPAPGAKPPPLPPSGGKLGAKLPQIKQKDELLSSGLTPKQREAEQKLSEELEKVQPKVYFKHDDEVLLKHFTKIKGDNVKNRVDHPDLYNAVSKDDLINFSTLLNNFLLVGKKIEVVRPQSVEDTYSFLQKLGGFVHTVKYLTEKERLNPIFMKKYDLFVDRQVEVKGVEKTFFGAFKSMDQRDIDLTSQMREELKGAFGDLSDQELTIDVAGTDSEKKEINSLNAKILANHKAFKALLPEIENQLASEVDQKDVPKSISRFDLILIKDLGNAAQQISQTAATIDEYRANLPNEQNRAILAAEINRRSNRNAATIELVKNHFAEQAAALKELAPFVVQPSLISVQDKNGKPLKLTCEQILSDPQPKRHLDQIMKAMVFNQFKGNEKLSPQDYIALRLKEGTVGGIAADIGALLECASTEQLGDKSPDDLCRMIAKLEIEDCKVISSRIFDADYLEQHYFKTGQKKDLASANSKQGVDADEIRAKEESAFKLLQERKEAGMISKIVRDEEGELQLTANGEVKRFEKIEDLLGERIASSPQKGPVDAKSDRKVLESLLVEGKIKDFVKVYGDINNSPYALIKRQIQDAKTGMNASKHEAVETYKRLDELRALIVQLEAPKSTKKLGDVNVKPANPSPASASSIKDRARQIGINQEAKDETVGFEQKALGTEVPISSAPLSEKKPPPPAPPLPGVKPRPAPPPPPAPPLSSAKPSSAPPPPPPPPKRGK